jgi:hypothetical protein
VRSSTLVRRARTDHARIPLPTLTYAKVIATLALFLALGRIILLFAAGQPA